MTDPYAAAGKLQALSHMHLRFLTPVPKLMAELMALLEDYRILAPVDLFFPVYLLSTVCNTGREGSQCGLAEDRAGVTIQESVSGSRLMLPCPNDFVVFCIFATNSISASLDSSATYVSQGFLSHLLEGGMLHGRFNKEAKCRVCVHLVLLKSKSRGHSVGCRPTN